MKELLLIVPTRGRPEKAKNFYNFFKKNSVISDICFGLDDDDYMHYEIEKEAISSINKNMKVCPKLNKLASKFVDEYKYIGFSGDDVQINTYGWDQILLEPLKDQIGISYGNDYYQGENLPNTFIVNSEVIKELGWMVPPMLDHFYMDNFYKDLGSELGILHYFPDVNLEHHHYINGKADFDETYKISAGKVEDKDIYYKYKEYFFEKDLNKIRNILK
jgi:hypothetical protein